MRHPNCARSDGVRFRKQVDWVQTLENYENRIAKYPKSFFLELDGSYLSDYMKFHGSHGYCSSPIPSLEKVCLSHNIHILGHVPANKKNGSYAYLPEKFPENAKIIYVGHANYITDQKDSRFAVSKKDKVWTITTTTHCLSREI